MKTSIFAAAATLLVAPLLSGCPAEQAAGDAAASRSESRGQLTQQQLTTRVDAGGWQALRLNMRELLPQGGETALGIAAEPGPEAEPYLWLAIHVSQHGNSVVPAILLPLALAGGAPSAERLNISADAAPPENYEIELALVLGSNGDPSRFRLGQVPTDLPREDIGAELAGRPEAALSLASGRGGAVGSYARLPDENGGRREHHAGQLSIEDEALAALPGGVEILRETRATARGHFDGPGVASFLLLGRPQAGAGEWAYRLDLPPQSLADQGHMASAGPLDLPVAIELLGIAPAAAFVQTATQSGDAALELSYQYSGREGDDVTAGLDPAVGFGGLVVTWGWLNIDLEALYGWQVAEVLPE